MLVLYNSLSRKKEAFRPIKKKLVGLYTCGPTVYQYAHLGNLRAYIFSDTVKRVLLLNGFRVKHIMNITDVGHLESDADTGEDKVEREAKRQQRSAWDIARFYEDAFKRDLQRLHILPPARYARATEHIKEQVALIGKLEQKGVTYRTSDGIYFDTAKFPTYGAFTQVDLRGIKPGIRIAQKEKRNPSDFALWKFSPKDKKRQMEWPSPWGKGFPGWHIECSAMSMTYLGEHFDIHTGGIDHISVHHTNEIAQSEAATGKPLANYWLHANFLQVGKTRMGKSEGNFRTLDELVGDGFDPLDFRYVALSAHYRSPLVFSRDALLAARRARLGLISRIQRIPASTSTRSNPSSEDFTSGDFKKAFLAALNNDLSTPRALPVLRRFVASAKARTKTWSGDLAWFDRALGLNLTLVLSSPPAAVRRLAAGRERLRAEKQWKEADALRIKIKEKGWRGEDTADGPHLMPEESV